MYSLNEFCCCCWEILGNSVKLVECAFESAVECVVLIFIIYMKCVDSIAQLIKHAYWLSGMDRCKMLLFDGKILPVFCPILCSLI